MRMRAYVKKEVRVRVCKKRVRVYVKSKKK